MAGAQTAWDAQQWPPVGHDAATAERLLLEYQRMLAAANVQYPGMQAAANALAQSLRAAQENLGQLAGLGQQAYTGVTNGGQLYLQQRQDLPRFGAVFGIGGPSPIYAREPCTEPEQKARSLLFRLLTKEQQEEYRSRGCFSLQLGNRQYQLGRGIVRVFNRSGEILESWCVGCPEGPFEDTLVAQILGLRHNLAGLRKAANVTVTPHDSSLAVRALNGMAVILSGGNLGYWLCQLIFM